MITMKEIGPARLDQIVEECLVEAERDIAGKSLAVTRQIGAEIPEASMDRRLMKEAVKSLIAEAIRTSEGSVPLRITVKSSGQMLMFSVKSRGRGMTGEEREDLFAGEPAAGSLARARGILTAHGGMAWANSAPGRGTTYYISFPVRRAGAGGYTPG